MNPLSGTEPLAPLPGTCGENPGEKPGPPALAAEYSRVRQQSLELTARLTPEDMMVQSSPEASPAKWHLAHTSWFFETFLLSEFQPGYRPFHPDFGWLFNSYYNDVSDQPAKSLRSTFSRPGLASILDYRRCIDEAMLALLESGPGPEAEDRIVLGLNHEQQHQELLLTDIKHAFWSNPLRPAYLEGRPAAWAEPAPAAGRIDNPGGLVEIGAPAEGFSFDNERPRHRVYLEPFALGSRAVTVAEYLEFVRDGGYQRPSLWLSAGWDRVRGQGWQAPLYWFEEGGEWHIFTLRGTYPARELEATPVCHVSLYEADAYARWAGGRLPTEGEWESSALEANATLALAEDNLLESGSLHPLPASPRCALQQLLGDVWEWTSSAYLGYPGYRPLPGALGEYNGKFMSGQMVLRGGSCATPGSHIRASYRNFFPPETRWQFSGIRLASL